MSTSVAYLRKRLADVGRQDLLDAAEAGLISTYAAAEEAGLVTRREVLGTGSPNQTKKRLWALSRIARGVPPLPPKPEPAEPAISPSLAHPKFSQTTRDVIERLVVAGRSDLVIAVTERRISPFQAARIAERGGSRRPSREASLDSSAPPPAPESPPAIAESPKSDEPATPKPKKNPPAKLVSEKTPISKLDVRALIA